MRLVELHQRYAPFRKTMLQYNERILNAPTIGELQSIDHELRSAWTNLLKYSGEGVRPAILQFSTYLRSPP